MPSTKKKDPFDAVRSAVDKDQPRTSLTDTLERLTEGEDGWRVKLEQLQTLHSEALNLVAYLERGDRFEAVVWCASEARAGIQNWYDSCQTQEEVLSDIASLLAAIDDMPMKPDGEFDDELTIPGLWDLLNPEFDPEWQELGEEIAAVDVVQRDKARARAEAISEAIEECELVIELADQASDSIHDWGEAEGRDEKADAREDAVSKLSELVDAVDDLAASEARINADPTTEENDS
jgi:hypothetical protein